MATKKARRSNEVKSKRQKKNVRISVFALIIVLLTGFLIFFFVSLFDFIFPPGNVKDGISRKKEKQAVILYFSDINERFLLPEKRYITKEENVGDQAKEIVKAVIDGSKTKLVNTFPEGVVLQSLKIDKDRIAYVSFSKDLMRSHPGGSSSEIATIYSLTNSLIYNIPSIDQVKLLVDEKEFASIRGHADTRKAFRFNKEMIAPRS
jgi:hypothetical protein